MWIAVCLFLLSPVAGNSVTQIPASASAREGRTVKLSCQYSTTYTYYAVGWYQQLPGQQPLFLLYRNERGNEYKPGSVAPRFSSQLDTGAKSLSLSIDGAQRADSAVYFCALWDPLCYRAPRAPDTNCRSGGRSRKRREMSHFPYVRRGEGEGSQVSEGTKKCVIVYKQGVAYFLPCGGSEYCSPRGLLHHSLPYTNYQSASLPSPLFFQGLPWLFPAGVAPLSPPAIPGSPIFAPCQKLGAPLFPLYLPTQRHYFAW
ncbi:unnamed protein product [Natator depressus]